jgi:hypothetical protein
MQMILADEYAGNRVRLSAWVKATEGGKPRIWMCVDSKSEILAFDNMDNRSMSGPFEWNYQEIVLDVKPPAVMVRYGLILDGDGAAWIDDVRLEVVPRQVRTTDLDFEEP